MSAHILAAISHLPQLHGSLRTTAQRLAYYADGAGRVQKAYSFLANDMHVSVRTVMRHVARLEAMAVIGKRVLRCSASRCAVNLYTFLLGVDPLHKRSRDTVTSEVAKKEKSSTRAGEKPTLTEAGARWYATYRRAFGLEEAPSGP